MSRYRGICVGMLVATLPRWNPAIPDNDHRQGVLEMHGFVHDLASVAFAAINPVALKPPAGIEFAIYCAPNEEKNRC